VGGSVAVDDDQATKKRTEEPIMTYALTLQCPEAVCRTQRSVSIPVPSLRRPVPRRQSPYFVSADFQAPDGRQAFAVGGGPTLEDAIASARESLPLSLDWDLARWNHVHGD
jgi:hypothetical protein